MVRMLFLLAAVLALAPAAAQELPSLVTARNADQWTGDANPNGSCSVGIAPAPGLAGQSSVCTVYRVEKKTAGRWINCELRPTPALDFSATRSLRLPVYAESEVTTLTIKLVDPDCPGQNHAAYEQPAGRLPARRWTTLTLPLPENPKQRDSITLIQLYMFCNAADVPEGQDMVLYFGQFPTPVAAAAPVEWPIRPTGVTAGKPVLKGAIADDGRFTFQHDARAENGAVLADTSALSTEWNEFLATNPERVVLAPGGRYRIGFDFTVTRQLTGKDATFYCLLRAGDDLANDLGWKRWTDPAGASGRKEFVVDLNRVPGYRLILGVRRGGGMRVENLSIEELPANAAK